MALIGTFGIAYKYMYAEMEKQPLNTDKTKIIIEEKWLKK
jgi:hypothetical protein